MERRTITNLDVCAFVEGVHAACRRPWSRRSCAGSNRVEMWQVLIHSAHSRAAGSINMFSAPAFAQDAFSLFCRVCDSDLCVCCLRSATHAELCTQLGSAALRIEDGRDRPGSFRDIHIGSPILSPFTKRLTMHCLSLIHI